MTPARRRELSHALAAALLGGPWTQETMVVRARATLDHRPRWLRALVRDVLRAYQRPPVDRARELAAYVAIFLKRRGDGPRPRRWLSYEPAMARAPWPVARLDTPADVAALLGVDLGTLAWLADVRGLERSVSDERLRHYRWRWVERPGRPPRPIAAPKARLKAAQRLLLREAIGLIAPHEAAHGFVAGRSAITHARLHVGRRVVLRFDLEDFFASVPAGRVYGTLRTAGYPEAVAHLLTGIVTTVVPRAAGRRRPGTRPR